MTRSSIAKRAREMIERDEEIDTAWDEEAERRVQQIDSAEVKTISWEEVRAKVYACLRER